MRWGLASSTPSSSMIIGLRAVASVRHLGDFLSELGLADVHPLPPAGEHGIDAVFAEQIGEFAQAISVGVDLRLDVAPGNLRRAGIGADQRFHVAVDRAAAENFQRRNQQAFLEQVGGIAAVGAGDLAAEVGLVRDVADEADDALAREHRRDDGHVGGVVLAGLVGMVDDEGVAGRGIAAIAPADLVHLCRQRPDMQGLRNALRHHAAVAVEDGEGEILALLDDRRIARAEHVEGELASDLQRRLIDDFEVDGVQWGPPSACSGEVGTGSRTNMRHSRILDSGITSARCADVNSARNALGAWPLPGLLCSVGASSDEACPWLRIRALI